MKFNFFSKYCFIICHYVDESTVLTVVDLVHSSVALECGGCPPNTTPAFVVPNLPDGYQVGDGMWGTQTASMAARLYNYGPPNTETNHILEYDGTSWSKLSTTCAQSIAAAACGKFGTSTAGVVFGGQPPHSNATEEWTRSTTVRTVDSST